MENLIDELIKLAFAEDIGDGDTQHYVVSLLMLKVLKN